MLAAYLKNSVTRLVEPLRVIAWRVGACEVAIVVSAKQGGERVLDAREITWRCFATHPSPDSGEGDRTSCHQHHDSFVSKLDNHGL